MTTHKRAVLGLSLFCYVVGLLLGLALAGSAVWADFESMFYGFSKTSDKKLPSLNCPVFMTSSETGTISAALTNPRDEPAELWARAEISTRGVAKVERKSIFLEPGRTGRVSWTVTQENVDLKRFIFAKVTTYPFYPLPVRESTCGILVLGVPVLTGNQVFALMLVGCVAGIGLGVFLWERNNQPLRGTAREAAYAMRLLAVAVLAGLLCSLQGWWLPGAVFLVLAVLAVVAVTFFVIEELK